MVSGVGRRMGVLDVVLISGKGEEDRSDRTPIYSNLSCIIIAVEVQWMYANYAVWCSRSGESKNDFFRWVGIPNRKG